MVRLQTQVSGFADLHAWGLQTRVLGADPPAVVSSDMHLNSVAPLGVRGLCDWVCRPFREEK